MFQGLINEAETAAGAVASKYATRLSVAVPFVIAVGFATIALMFVLANAFGIIIACVLIAVDYAAIGVVAAVSVSAMEKRHAVELAARKPEAHAAVADAAETAMVEAPLALLVGLLSSVGGPTAAFSAAKAVKRNLPLILLVGMIGVLFMPGRANPEKSGEDDLDPNKLNGARHPKAETNRQHA